MKKPIFVSGVLLLSAILLASLAFTSKQEKLTQLGQVAFDVQELKEIIQNNDDLVGLAFKTKAGADLNTEVLLVKWEEKKNGRTLVGKPVPVNSFSKNNLEVGTDKPEGFDYAFEFSDLLSKRKFGFAMATIDQLDLLLNQDSEKIYLRGSKVDFGKTKGKKSEYFSFTLEVPGGKENRNMSVMGVPGSFVLHPCPPRWWTDDRAIK